VGGRFRRRDILNAIPFTAAEARLLDDYFNARELLDRLQATGANTFHHPIEIFQAAESMRRLVRHFGSEEAALSAVRRRRAELRIPY
jgi:hypothetical protein